MTKALRGDDEWSLSEEQKRLRSRLQEWQGRKFKDFYSIQVAREYHFYSWRLATPNESPVRPDLLRTNRISDEEVSGLMEGENGPPEVLFTGRNTTAKAATPRRYSVRVWMRVYATAIGLRRTRGASQSRNRIVIRFDNKPPPHGAALSRRAVYEKPLNGLHRLRGVNSIIALTAVYLLVMCFVLLTSTAKRTKIGIKTAIATVGPRSDLTMEPELTSIVIGRDRDVERRDLILTRDTRESHHEHI
ncbi:hypothetical protein EVAR_63311_1 [Eumeta japonica]|uniref:Uncharacterized protein n=1 Tax=Eumeta variegata TaxID=151549 RepID=A0A4C1YQ01_EUMVA|nr:hypothetical protein EVAR_63311_1 [Eumeta japonica]